MRIIKPGVGDDFKPLADSQWWGRCKTCGCEFACTGADVSPLANSGGWIKDAGHHVFYANCPQAGVNNCTLSGVTEVFPVEIDDEPFDSAWACGTVGPTATPPAPAGDGSCPSTLPP